MNFCIVIPTHKRDAMIRKKTLSLLNRHNIPHNKIYILPSDTTYFENKENENYNVLNLPAKDILESRNSIIDYFPQNQQIVEMDDDIDDIINKDKSPVKDLMNLINYCFNTSGGNLWGFNSNDNMFYSDGKLKIGLYSIINSVCGYENDKDIKLNYREKEDFDRVIQHFMKNKPVYKFTKWGIKTKYWTNKGGLQDLYNESIRNNIQKQMADRLCNEYPLLVYKLERKNGKTDIRFKRQGANTQQIINYDD